MVAQLREVRVSDLILYAVLSPIILAAIWILTPLYLVDLIPIPSWILYVIAGVLSYFQLKRWIIGLVLMYKAFAPLSVRGRCRFTPTCSTYMIMAINKYGLIYGVAKGVNRIFRCKPPNGGIDYP